MNDEMSMTAYDGGMISIQQDLQSHPNSYCSIKPTTTEEKKADRKSVV